MNKPETIFIKEIMVTDPDTGSQVPVEIHKDKHSGGIFGVDATFIEQKSDYVRSIFNDYRITLARPDELDS